MEFKKNVRLHGIILHCHALDIVDQCYHAIVGHYALMTSANDSKHSEKSLHYKNRAWDFRTKKDNKLSNLPYEKEILFKLVERLQDYLGAGYQVILEDDHIHVEYDPTG